MNSRFNYKPIKKRDSSQDDIFYIYKYEESMEVISTHKDGTVDKYKKSHFWKKEKSSWSEYIKSFDLGSVQEQVVNHITKGTPLVTAHTLPNADYTKLGKAIAANKELNSKGLTIEQIVDAVNRSLMAEQEEVKEQPKEEKVEKEGE